MNVFPAAIVISLLWHSLSDNYEVCIFKSTKELDFVHVNPLSHIKILSKRLHYEAHCNEKLLCMPRNMEIELWVDIFVGRWRNDRNSIFSYKATTSALRGLRKEDFHKSMKRKRITRYLTSCVIETRRNCRCHWKKLTNLDRSWLTFNDMLSN